MPGRTDYMDTPVLPVAAFASGFNPPDCAYPDATPAIKSVTGDLVPANAASSTASGGAGPWVSASGHTLTITALGNVVVPNNAYAGPAYTTGIASQKTITRHYGFGSTPGTVTIGGQALTNVAWSDLQITGNVPNNVPACPAPAPAGSRCGELVITAANNKKSVDAVTVTVGGPIPSYVASQAQAVASSTSGLPHPIQDAIDAANPGDMIILGPGTYPELVVMWKPVRLQGVGAASVIISAAKYPTQKLDNWRAKINGLFNFDSQGNALPGAAQVDPLPGQEITGGIVILEPSVLSTEEGAGITVLAKNLPASACGSKVGGAASNFLCAPSRIDGVTVTGGDSGGGIYVNGWAHNLEIANNRVYGNAGAFNGGIRIGQPYLEGQVLPNGFKGLGYDNNLSIHHNMITNNGTVEANNGEAGAGGGLSLCSGTDNYAVNFNFICGNVTLGDGGGIGHIGLSMNGSIANNWILFNQSYNLSGTSSGGGIAIEGEPSTLGGLSLGSGNVQVDSNLIQGNQAQGGHGGGIRLQNVNGADIAQSSNQPNNWWQVTLTNNMIADNVAGWSGGGISLLDAAYSQILNNTVVSNDSTATVGAVFSTNPSTSTFQPAGISSELHSPALAAALGNGIKNRRPDLVVFSNPTLQGNVIWQNRSFYFTSGATDPNTGLTTAALIPTLTQTSVGQCPGGANYWDLGILGQPQANPTLSLNPQYSILTSTTGYAANNISANPSFVSQYCNGSRANPGPTANPPVVPVPQFAMQPTVTEDEGGNWIDVRFGPLSLSNSSSYTLAGTVLPFLGDYGLAAGSPAINSYACSAATGVAPTHDFFGNARPIPACSQNSSAFDRGATEFNPAKGPQ
jgi:parallel beta-helix repeat protein